MKVGLIGSCALGLTVALTLGAAPARAQNTGSATDTTARAGSSTAPGSTSGTTTAPTGRRPRHRRMRNGTAAGDTTNMDMNANGSANMNQGATNGSTMNMGGRNGGGMNMASADDTTSMSAHHRRSRRSTTHHRRHLATSGATSSERIPLIKSTSGGEVTSPDTTTPAASPAPAPIDTTARTDTTTRVDTTTRADTTTHVDTTTQRTDTTTATVIPSLSMHRLGSFYWGIGAGASMPESNMRNGYNTGWNVTVPFGWDSQSIPLGLRFDAGYDRLMGRSDVGVSGDLAVWSGNADAKLRLGSLLRHFYVLGGVGAARIVGYGTNNNTPAYGTTATTSGYNGTYGSGATVASSFGNAKTEMNWNAGGGVDFGWGRSALFLESRYFHINTNESLGANTRFVPVIIGLTFR